jgi:hypothetical protein
VKQTWPGFSEFGKRPRPAANSFGAAGQFHPEQTTL